MKRGIFLASALCACISCSDDNVDNLKRASLNHAFSSQMNERVYVADTVQSFTVEVSSINDHRCSIHTNYCNDKGICAVRIKLYNLDNAYAETILSIDNSELKHLDTVSLNLNKKTYQVLLNQVNPKPCELKPDDTPKTAEFLIREYKSGNSGTTANSR